MTVKKRAAAYAQGARRSLTWRPLQTVD